MADRNPAGVLPLLLIVVSFLIALLYYTKNESALEPKEYVSPFTPAVRDSAEEPSSEPAENQSKLEIAVPQQVYLMVTDPQGRQTGRTAQKKIINDIPLSEYVIDSNDEVLHWVTILSPIPGTYTLRVDGHGSNDAVIVYSTNVEGEVQTELIDINANGTIAFTLDPASQITVITGQ